MKNTLSNTPTKIFKSVCTSNVYPRLPMALCLVLCTLGLGLSVNAGGTKHDHHHVRCTRRGHGGRSGHFASGMNLSGAIDGIHPGRQLCPARLSARSATGPLPSSTIRPRALVQHPVEPSGTARVRVVTPSTHLGRSPDSTPTIAPDVTASCVLLTAPSPRSMLRTRAQDRFPRAPSPQKFTPMGINPAGAITGFYVDANSVQHGFVRARSGKITEFDPTGSIFTNPNAIDAPGNITGFYFDANFVGHGFLRDPGGTITSFDAPGADHTAGSGNGTFGVGLTPNGEIEGVYVDVNGVLHGFVRSNQGTFTTFDAPGAGTGAGQGTLPESNNTPGAIAGNYIDGNGVNHGFLCVIRRTSACSMSGHGHRRRPGHHPLGQQQHRSDHRRGY